MPGAYGVCRWDDVPSQGTLRLSSPCGGGTFVPFFSCTFFISCFFFNSETVVYVRHLPPRIRNTLLARVALYIAAGVATSGSAIYSSPPPSPQPYLSRQQSDEASSVQCACIHTRFDCCICQESSNGMWILVLVDVGRREGIYVRKETFFVGSSDSLLRMFMNVPPMLWVSSRSP